MAFFNFTPQLLNQKRIEMKDKILEYLNNELSPTERVEFEKAIAADPILQQEFQFQQHKWMQLRTAYLKQVAQTKAQTWATGAAVLRRKQKVIRLRMVLGIAACFAVVYFKLRQAIGCTIQPSKTQPRITVLDTTAFDTITAIKSVLTSPATPAKKVEMVLPKTSKSKSQAWAIAQVPEPATPVKPTTAETTQVELVKTEPAKPILASSLDNMSEFTGEKGLIHKHLNKIDCNNFTVSFIIKATGMIADPQWVKGDEKCKEAALAQIRSMPQLKTPILDKKPADYKYFFSKR
ncbi:MAG: hypothetical protein RLZZ628_4363 [Bacteroidota bacterium]|jgi:hypothetical protein